MTDLISPPLGAVTEASTPEQIDDALGVRMHQLPPQDVSITAAIKAMLLSGLFGPNIDAVEAAIEGMFDALPEPKRSIAMIDWRRSKRVYRNNPTLQAAVQLGALTQSQLDALFAAAHQIDRESETQ